MKIRTERRVISEVELTPEEVVEAYQSVILKENGYGLFPGCYLNDGNVMYCVYTNFEEPHIILRPATDNDIKVLNHLAVGRDMFGPGPH